MKNLLCLLLLSLSLNLSAAPLFPEDASKRVGAWYFSELNYHYTNKSIWSQIEVISQKHNFELRNLGRVYEWIQDVALFDEDHTFVAPAKYGSRYELLHGLTMGVINEEDYSGNSPYRLPTDSFAKVRQKEGTFVEGGALIGGRMADGSPYVITNMSALRRAQKFLSLKYKREVSDLEARDVLARDLGVELSHLHLVVWGRHLDLVLFPLSGGRVLVNDPLKVPQTIEELLEQAPATEQERLLDIKKLYTLGYQNYYSDRAPPHLRGKPMHEPRFPYDEHELKLLDGLVQQLSSHFEVHRVAGVFKEKNPSLFSPEDRINFINAFQGKDSQDRHWIVSNSARGLSSLETYWKNLVNGYTEGNSLVYFPGNYSAGAGIDCVGAVAGVD